MNAAIIARQQQHPNTKSNISKMLCDAGDGGFFRLLDDDGSDDGWRINSNSSSSDDGKKPALPN